MRCAAIGGLIGLVLGSLLASQVCVGRELIGYPNATGGRDWFYGARPLGHTQVWPGGVKRFVPWRRYGHTVPVEPYDSYGLDDPYYDRNTPSARWRYKLR